MYIFLDESGQFKKYNHHEYFVIGSFTVGNQRRTDKAFRGWIRKKFPKKMRFQSEVKWSAKNIDDDLRLRTLQYIADLDVRIRYGYLLRENIPFTYKTKKNKIDSGILYTNIVGEILEQYLPTKDKQIFIFCDRRSLKGMTRQEFQLAIQARLLPQCVPDTRIQVEMIDSTTNANMQIVDWISGAIAYFLENEKFGSEYYEILSNNILAEGQEFFREK